MCAFETLPLLCVVGCFGRASIEIGLNLVLSRLVDVVDGDGPHFIELIIVLIA